MHRFSIAFAALVLIAGIPQAFAAAPKVVVSSPDDGEIDVDPATTQIRIEFNQPMDSRGRSILGGGDSFPDLAGDPKWVNPKVLILPVKLKPDHQYVMNFNSDTYKGFASKSGQPADWYPLSFRTRATGGKPAAPDVTPAQNKIALKNLADAIDGDYGYRDRKKVDWAREIDKRRASFEMARSANQFARLAAHLLRLAEDAHVFVEAGDVRIGTYPNSTPPNFSYPQLSKSVPHWKEHPSGIVTGKFDDGIGYILFSNCSAEQSDGFDEALNNLKDTTALILDARFNGGGDELAAQRVAGRFAEKPAVYSRNRIRESGKWNGPIDRTVEPRRDAERYTKPVAVLIGPKVGSSAESFVLMMKYGGNAKLVGSPTKGSSGRPLPHRLGNGVTVYLPSWEDQEPDGTLIEGRGVQPDIAVKTTLRDLEKSDPVLTAGLKYVRGNAGR